MIHSITSVAHSTLGIIAKLVKVSRSSSFLLFSLSDFVVTPTPLEVYPSSTFPSLGFIALPQSGTILIESVDAIV